MKRLYFYAAVIVMAIVTACGGNSRSVSSGGNSRVVSSLVSLDKVDLDDLEDYFSVTAVSIESDAKEKGPNNINGISGKITFSLKRNGEKMDITPERLRKAEIEVKIDRTINDKWVYERFIETDCSAAVKSILNTKPNATVSFTVDFHVKQETDWDEIERQAIFDALTKDNGIEKIKVNTHLRAKKSK